MFKSLSIIFTFLFINTYNLYGQTLTIAVASNFHPTLKELIKIYEKKHSDEIKIVPGSSGKLYAQVLHGAPFDLFLSGDKFRVNQLLEKGIIKATDHKVYAKGQLAIWSKSKINCQNSLALNDYKYLAIANPKTAPYGFAAQQYLQNKRFWESTKSKIVYGENVAQTVHFVQSGNAQVGLVAYSLVKHNDINQCIKLVNPKMYSPIVQKVAILKNTKSSKRFYRFLNSKKAKIVIQNAGYLI